MPITFAVIALLGVYVQAPVVYEISFRNAVHHEAEVRATFPDLPARPLEVRMSRTSPGRYALHEFAKNVYHLRAYDGRGREIAAERANPHQWNIPEHDGTVVITYTLYADHADGTYSGIDESHAHLNMPATFIWARGLGDRPIEITFHPLRESNWRAATQLAPTEKPYTFRAPDLDYFMDSPTELSDFTLREWEVEARGSTAATIRLAVHHAGSEADVDAFVEMIKPVVEEARGVFGEFPRFDYGAYTFIADYLPWVYGDGMEHRNSTILSSRAALADAASRLIGTVSHEFFHAWNVERIRPRSLEPFDFEAENMSRELWFAEGFTSYYGLLLLRRADLIDDASYAGQISNQVSTVIQGTGRRYRSAVGMSMEAPFVDAAVWVDETNQLNTFISYYTWGAGIALALDLTLRARYPGLDLDQYMRAVWQKHGAGEQPYTLEDLEAVLSDLTRDPSFARTFFERYVNGRAAADYERLLDRAGFLLRPRNPGQPTLGWVELRDVGRGAEIRSATLVGTPLYEAGLDRGDVILRLDGQPLRSAADAQAILRSHRPGERVALEFEQRGRQKRANLRLAENRWLEVVPFEQTDKVVSPSQLAFRRAWLGAKRR